MIDKSYIVFRLLVKFLRSSEIIVNILLWQGLAPFQQNYCVNVPSADTWGTESDKYILITGSMSEISQTTNQTHPGDSQPDLFSFVSCKDADLTTHLSCEFFFSLVM